MSYSPLVETCLAFLLAGIAIFFSKRTVRWWRRRPWELKGFSLHGATVFVESITPLLPTSQSLRGGDDGMSLRYHFLANVTIKPANHATRIPWVPGDLQVVPAEDWRPDRPDSGELRRYSRIESLEIVCGAKSFEPGHAFTVAGQCDLRLRLSVRHDIRILQFRYYLEQFGVLQLPAPMTTAEAASDLLVTP